VASVNVGAQPLTFFVVARSTQNAPTTGGYLWDTATTGSNNKNVVVQSAAGNVLKQFDGTLGNGVTIAPSVDFILVSYFNGASSEQILNGGTPASGTNVGTSSSGNKLTVGNSGTYATSGTCWGGNIYEIICYAATLTSAQITQVYNYLYGKYVSPAAPPSTIPGLVCWLRGDLGITLGTGSNVASWADQSGLGNNAVQATSTKQPTTSTIGVQSAVAFSGTQAFTFSNAFTDGPATIIVVHQQAAQPANGQFYSLARPKNSDVTFFEIGLFNGGGYESTSWKQGYGSVTGAGSGINPTLDLNVHALMVTYNGAGNGTPANYRANLDGTTQSVVASANFLAQTTDLGALGGRISSANAVTFGYDGAIAEVIIYNQALSAANIAVLNTYLQQRYGV
jgi:hypothetical protein